MLQKSKLTFIFISLLGQLSAQAQSSTESAAPALPQGNGSQLSTSLDTKEELKKPAKNFAVALSLTKSVSLYKTGDGNDAESFDGAISGSMKVSEALTMGLLIERGLDEKTQEADWGRVSLSASGRKLASRYADITPRVSLGLPASKKDLANSLRGRVSVSANFAIKTEIPSLELSYTPAFGYANFAYETNEFTGNPNSPFSVVQELGATYSFNSKLTAKVAMTYLAQQTMTKFVKEVWSHNEELAWQMPDRWFAESLKATNWTVALGHQFGVPYTPIRKANQDMNLAFLNETDSVIYTQLTVDF